MIVLSRESEPYSKYGNISADGFNKLLGTPNLDQFQTVIRESVQNSWDARLEGKAPEYHLRLRTLNREQVSILIDNVFHDLPDEPADDRENRIQDIVKRGCELRVLELCDFNTSGLGGPVNPEEVEEEGESPDFVDFFRNIGTPRDTHHGGGTYGYGKSSLFSFSRCNTIVVDSVAFYKGELVRRLMACRVGNRYNNRTGDKLKRFTGRHWWGSQYSGRLYPVSGNDAVELSEKMGFSERDSTNTGSSIMILEPKIEDLEKHQIEHKLKETILWNFWNKMIPFDGRGPDIRFRIEMDGRELRLPDPRECPPLDLYARAMHKIRSVDENLISIRCKKPKKELGKLAIVRGTKSKRNFHFSALGEDNSESSHHVALMRPAELIVKYMKGCDLPDEDVEWAGVFKTSNEEDVEKAFADSEPPAHDDWKPNNLKKGSLKKRYVNVALKRIKNKIKDKFNPEPDYPEDSDSNISLGGLADKIGNSLLNIGGSRLGGVGPRGGTGGGGGGKSKSVSLRTPVYLRHEIVDEKPCILFSQVIRGSSDEPVIIDAKAEVILEGGGRSAVAPNGRKPEVLKWIDEENNVISEEDTAEVICESNKTLIIIVTIPDYVAISLRTRIREEMN